MNDELGIKTCGDNIQKSLVEDIVKYLSCGEQDMLNTLHGAVSYYHAGAVYIPNPYLQDVPKELISHSFLSAAIPKATNKKDKGDEPQVNSFYISYYLLNGDQDYLAISGKSWSSALSQYALKGNLKCVDLLLAYSGAYIETADKKDLSNALSYLSAGYAYGSLTGHEVTQSISKLMAVAASYIDRKTLVTTLTEFILMKNVEAFKAILENLDNEQLAVLDCTEDSHLNFVLDYMNRNTSNSQTPCEFIKEA